jgi:hypothetical protein
MLRALIAGATAALALFGAGAPAGAATSGANFGVMVTLSNPNPSATAATSTGPTPTAQSPSGICSSQSLSERTGAVVRVVCGTGQFVSISPSPGQRFFGTHGGAYGYYFGPAYGAIHRTAYGGAGGGTITSFRVYSIEGADGPLDLLVSF